jgi:hypothetical protein
MIQESLDARAAAATELTIEIADLAIRLLVEQLVVPSLNWITTDNPILFDNEGEDVDVSASLRVR